MKTFMVMVLLAMLTACANVPSRYYSLAAIDHLADSSTPSSAVPASAAQFAIRVPDLRIPEQVDRPQLVVRADSATAVTVLNQSLWAAPLAEEIRATIAQEVARILGVPDVSFMSAPARLPVWTIDVQVRRFELFAGARTVLDASWTFEEEAGVAATRGHRAGSGTEPICRAVIQMRVDQEGVEPLVDRQRSAILELAANIAEAITARQNSTVSRGGSHSGCTFL